MFTKLKIIGKIINGDGYMLKKQREVPVKNYIYLALIILVSLLLLFYFYLWHLTYEEGKLNNPIMDKYLQVINYNELSNYITENKEAYVYVSVLEDKNIRDFEKKFKTVIINNSLKDSMLYLDLTETYNNKELQKAKETYSIGEKTISNVPCILVFKDGILSKIYDIKENNYDLEKLEVFLQEEGLEEND